MAENSPTFQRWGRECRGAQVPKGRLKPCAIRQPSLRDLSDHGRWFPTLKRWAIIECPSGTKTCPGLAYFVGASPSDIGHSCRVRDTFLQIPDLRRFLLRGIDVYLYYAHEYTSHTSVPHRTYPPDPTHGARLPLYYRPGTQRSLLQPQLLGKRQKPLPLSAPRQSPRGPTGHRGLPPIPAPHRAIRSADHRTNPRRVEYRRT